MSISSRETSLNMICLLPVSEISRRHSRESFIKRLPKMSITSWKTSQNQICLLLVPEISRSLIGILPQNLVWLLLVPKNVDPIIGRLPQKSFWYKFFVSNTDPSPNYGPKDIWAFSWRHIMVAQILPEIRIDTTEKEILISNFYVTICIYDLLQNFVFK